MKLDQILRDLLAAGVEPRTLAYPVRRWVATVVTHENAKS
jgi:hypothetical protein